MVMCFMYYNLLEIRTFVLRFGPETLYLDVTLVTYLVDSGLRFIGIE